MSFADDIAEQRKTRAAEQASKDAHSESVQAIVSSGKDVADATNKLATTQDVDGIIRQLKEIQLDQLIATQTATKKPEPNTVIIKDQIDIGDKITELADKVTEAVKGLDSSESNQEQLSTLKDLKSSLDTYSKSLTSSDATHKKASADLLKAIKAIKVAPVVNVPEPKVTVQPQDIDFGPLQETIKEYAYTPTEDDSIDLACYKAQDIDNTNPEMQYVGFLNQEGNWYIIENDVKGNKLRYRFGNSGYSEAFASAAEYTYSLLNEAIDALST